MAKLRLLVDERRLVGNFCGGCVEKHRGASFKEKMQFELRSDKHHCIWCPLCKHVFSSRCDLHPPDGEALLPEHLLYPRLKSKINSWL